MRRKPERLLHGRECDDAGGARHDATLYHDQYADQCGELQHQQHAAEYWRQRRRQCGRHAGELVERPRWQWHGDRDHGLVGERHCAAEPGTTYLTVTAQDAAGNTGTDILTVTYTPPPPDTTAPTVPGSLGATAASASQINLSWTASTDNVGVTGYQIERCTGAGCSNFAPLTTVTTTSYSNTGLAASTSYSYRVRARMRRGTSVATRILLPPPRRRAHLQRSRSSRSTVLCRRRRRRR